jgi:hypothetical protein
VGSAPPHELTHVTTGYARGILHDDAELLAKPFTPEDLAARMRDLIDWQAA